MNNHNKAKKILFILCALFFISLISIGVLIKIEPMTAHNSTIVKTTAIPQVDVPDSYMITDKNYFDYQTGTECAAFSSAYILRHFGEEADGMKLFETFPCKVPDGGVSPYGIVEFFEKHGYMAEYKQNGTIEELKQQISKGTPVIAFIRVNEDTIYTHYVPIVGYDNDYFYFAESLDYMANCKDEEGLSYNRKTEISSFLKLWDNIDGFWDYPYFVISKTEGTDEN